MYFSSFFFFDWAFFYFQFPFLKHLFSVMFLFTSFLYFPSLILHFFFLFFFFYFYFYFIISSNYSFSIAFHFWFLLAMYPKICIFLNVLSRRWQEIWQHSRWRMPVLISVIPDNSDHNWTICVSLLFTNIF